MATSRRRTAKSTIGQNLNDLDRRLKQIERRPRATVASWSVFGDMIAPGSITLDKLDPSLLALLQETYSSGDAVADTSETNAYGITDAVISSAEFSTNAANGKNSLFFQNTPPSEGTYLVDDIWYDTSLDTDGRPKYTPYQWDGDSWEPAPFGDAAFRFLNAGKIATGVLDAAAIVRVGQYPTPEGSSRLEISGGNGSIEFETELAAAVTSLATTMTVVDASGLPDTTVTYNLKIDSGTPDEEVVLVTSRSGAVLTVQRGVSGSSAAHDAGAQVTYASTLYAGITVLTNEIGSGLGLDSASQAALPALLRINASEGSFFLGEGDDYLKFNTADSPGRLSLSGRLLVGIGAESVAIGPDISGAQDGIRLGPNNWWYRPGSTLAEYPSGNLFFQVGMGGSELISVHTDGTVTVEGGVSPVRGTIKGRLGIRLAEGNASDKFLIGQNLASLTGLSGDEFDGIKLNANNYWVLSNTGKRAYLRVGGSGNYVSYNPVTDKLKLSGQLVAGEGTNNTVSIGADVGGAGIAGMKIDSSNYWYDADKVSANATVFKVSGANNTAITVNKAGDVTVEGITNPTGGTVKGKLTIQGTTYAFGKDVMSTKDGLYLNANNYWTLNQTGAAANISIGGATKNVTWDGTSLTVTGGDIALTGGGSFKTSTGNTRVEMSSNGIFGYVAGTKTFWIDAATGDSSFEGVTNPTGGTVKGKLTIQGTTYAFGKDVMSVRDGLYLNANNYWTLSQTGATAQFKIGGATRYLEWTGSALNIATDSLTIAGQAAVTSLDLSGKADATGSAILSLLNTGMGTGVVLTSSGQIYSAGKTAYDSATAGWYLGYNSGSPKFGIGNSSRYMRWDTATGTLEIAGKVVAGSSLETTNPGDSITVPGGRFIKSSAYGSGISFAANKIFISDTYGGGSIVFSDGADTASPTFYGGVFPSNGSKFSQLVTSQTSGGTGIIIGTTSYPFIEMGVDSSGAKKIFLRTADGIGMEIRPSNFILNGGTSSRINGLTTYSTTPNKYLGRDSQNTIAWYDGPAAGTGIVVSTSGPSNPSAYADNTVWYVV